MDYQDYLDEKTDYEIQREMEIMEEAKADYDFVCAVNGYDKEEYTFDQFIKDIA